MDKLLTKARHSLLIVSFLGIVFSLTGASFTGQSAIASYLGLKFSDVNGFKIVYLLILFYLSIRYVIHYSDEFVTLMVESIRLNVDDSVFGFLLKKKLLNSINGINGSHYHDVTTRDSIGREKDKCFVIVLFEGDGSGRYKSLDVELDFQKKSFSRICYFHILPGGGYDNDVDGFKYLNSYQGKDVWYVNRFSIFGAKLMVSWIAGFVFHAFTRVRHFEYLIPLVVALSAFFMTIKYFFFSGKPLGTLPLIFNGFI